MIILSELIRLLRKRKERILSEKIWREHGNETKYHFHDDRILIGDKTYGIPVIDWFDDNRKLIIGKFCSIASGVNILMGGFHHTEWITTYPFYKDTEIFTKAKGMGDIEKRDTLIGNDVWIGRNATILGGVHIGDGAVIGAGCVVSKNVPPYAIVIGNPMRTLRYRFSKDVIELLLKLSWWDWSDSQINKCLPILMSDDIEALKKLALAF